MLYNLPFCLDFLSGIGDAIEDALSSTLETILENTIYKWMYYLVAGLCKIVGYLDSLYRVFSGQDLVEYDGSHTFLTNVFFENHTINNMYWAMAGIGIALAFAFGIIGVIRKMFDARDKDQRSVGQVVGSLGKSILLIISMNFIMVVVLSFTNVLLQQITYAFDYAGVLDQKKGPIEFSDEQYAAMGRVMNTIGNYSISPSYASTYNINSCFNDIRGDLNYLSKQGVFDYYYETKNDKGQVVDTWQSLLQDIARSANLSRDLKMDVYYEDVSKAIKKAMTSLQSNNSLKPLSRYEREYEIKVSEGIPLDRYVFLVGSLHAAKNSQFNQKPEISDALRGPYFFGDKDIYNFDVVRADFSFAFDSYDYLMTIVVIIVLAWNLVAISYTCIVRIFMLLVLYIVAPLIFAIEPLDDGEKRKQWTTAFIVQSFGFFGTIIAMRVVMLFIPIVLSPNLVLFQNAFTNFLAKTLIIICGFMAATKAGGLISGILANNAGAQAVISGEGEATRLMMAAPKAMGAAGKLGMKALGVGASAVGSMFGGGGGGGSSSGGGGGGGGGSDDVSGVMQPLPESNHNAGQESSPEGKNNAGQSSPPAGNNNAGKEPGGGKKDLPGNNH